MYVTGGSAMRGMRNEGKGKTRERSKDMDWRQIGQNETESTNKRRTDRHEYGINRSTQRQDRTTEARKLIKKGKKHQNLT